MNNALVNLLVRWFVLACGVGLSTKLVDGIKCQDSGTLIAVALLLSLANAVLKPLLVLFTLPFIVLSLGLGVWLINALLFYFVGHLVSGFVVTSFGAAIWGALIVSVTNLVLSRLLTPAPRPAAPPANRRDDVIDI